jgi:hypothetical protein
MYSNFFKHGNSAKLAEHVFRAFDGGVFVNKLHISIKISSLKNSKLNYLVIQTLFPVHKPLPSSSGFPYALGAYGQETG